MSKHQTQEEKDLLTDRKLDVSAAARVLGCSVSTIYRLMHTGQLKYIRVGPRKGYKIPLSALQEFIEKRLANV